MTMPPPPPAQPPYHPAPQAMNPQDEKAWATLAHLSGILSILGPLISYLVLRDRGPFIPAHSAGALNFQLTMLIGVLVSFPLMLIGIGFLTVPAIGVFAVVIAIVGGVKANQGQWYTPPLGIRFVS